MSIENDPTPQPHGVAAPSEPVEPNAVPVPPVASERTVAEPVASEPVASEPVASEPEVVGPDVSEAVEPQTPAAPQTGLPGAEISGAPVAAAPVYRAVPTPPKRAGNRGIGTLIALVGTVLFAAVYAGVASVIFAFTVSLTGWISTLLRFMASAAFITPVVFFAVGLIVLVLIANRARWWVYVLGGFPVAVFVYAGTIVGALITVQGWTLTLNDQIAFIGSLVMDPLPLAAGIVAREATIWVGAWLSFRGRRVTARNAAAKADYERALAEAAAAGPAAAQAW